MYLAVQPAEAAALKKLTELIGVIVEDSAQIRPPGPPDFRALETRLLPEFRFLLSRRGVRKAVEKVYQLPYLDRLRVYESFQNDKDFPRHIHDSGYRLSNLSDVSEKGYAALKELCTCLSDITFKDASESQDSKSKKKLYDSALLRRRFREHNGEFGQVCPVCLQEVYFSEWEGDVDHYFPKAAHPTLTFHPYNLLPTCSDCNGPKNKSSKEPVDPKDAGPGELQTVFLPYLRAASQEVELNVVESGSAENYLKIAINPGPGGGPWTGKRIENMDRLYHLSSRWRGVLEKVCGDMKDENLQKRAEGVTLEEWPAALREILSATAKSTKGRSDFIKGVYCSWLLERSDEELLERFPYRTLSLPPPEE